MPLSTVTVTGSWVTPDNNPATGVVTIQPVAEVTASGTIVAGSAVTIPLVAGAISKTLVNNTQATALQYQVTERIDGAPIVQYVITPTGSNLDLSTAPRSSAATALLFILASQLGVPGGVVPLDGSAHIPSQFLPAGSGVLSVTNGDSTITIGGSAANPTVAVASIPESKVTGLTTDLAAINTSLGTKATKPAVRTEVVANASDLTLPNTGGVWVSLGAPLEIDLPASVGDYVELEFNAMRNSNANAFLDVAVIVGSSLVRYGANNTSSPALEGNPAFYTQATFIVHAGVFDFVVGSGDLDVVGGVNNVRFVMACKANGSGTLFDSTTYPFRWRAFNHGPVN